MLGRTHTQKMQKELRVHMAEKPEGEDPVSWASSLLELFLGYCPDQKALEENGIVL